MTTLKTLFAALLLFSAMSLAGCDSNEAGMHGVENAVDELPLDNSATSNDVATEAGRPLPEFKIPAPRASAQMVLPRSIVPPAQPTLQQVAAALRSKLNAAGYDDLGYYRVTNGFALATGMERVGLDGRPFPGAKRWATEASGLASLSGSFSLSAMRDALFNADPGSYRVLVFVVTNKPVTSSAEAMPSDVAKTLVVEGASDLPEKFAEARFGSDYRITALIYEFSRTAVGKPAQFARPSARPAAQQLRLANILGG